MWKYLLAVPALLLCSQIPILADVIVPGTDISVRPDTTIHVATWERGRIYPAYVAKDVYAKDGNVAIPRGSEAELIVRQTGPGQLVVDLESIRVNGQRYVMDTTGPQFHMSQPDYHNGTGLVGVITGTTGGEQVITSGSEINLPSGSVITFQLQEPLSVATWAEPGYVHEGYHYHPDNNWYR